MPSFFRINILSRYLFREILHYFFIFLAITVVILLISQFYDMRSKLLGNSPPLRIYVEYLVFSIPEDLAQVLPLIALISTMFSYGLLAKNKEILAMVAAGMSFRRLALPAMAFGLGVTALLYWFNESIVPQAMATSQVLQDMINGKTPGEKSDRGNLFIKGTGSSFIFIERYLFNSREMLYPTVFEVNQSGGALAERLEGDRAVLVSNGSKSSTWKFEGAERWQFNDDGTLRNYQKFKEPLQLELSADLDQFLKRTKNPDEMNYRELKEYRNLVLKQGGEKTAAYSLTLEQKLSFPIACLLLALLGYSVVADVHARRFAQGVFGGLLVTVIFYVSNALLTSIAKKETIQPAMACWLPIVCFVVLNYLLMLRLNRVRG